MINTLPDQEPYPNIDEIRSAASEYFKNIADPHAKVGELKDAEMVDIVMKALYGPNWHDLASKIYIQRLGGA